MERIGRYQLSGIPGFVNRLIFEGRTVDYWAPDNKTSHLLIAHDGQNVFDHRTATHRRTWKMAQSAVNVSVELGIIPPAIIAVFHSRTSENPWGRIIDLAPQDLFQNGVKPSIGASNTVTLEELASNKYLRQITEVIAPEITTSLELNLDDLNKAVVGSSLGGLASLYALAKYPDFFTTALALSPHWSIGERDFVDALIEILPTPGRHKVWMSHGTRGIDAKYGPAQRYADQKMVEAGWQINRDYKTQVYKKSGHNERSWARYLDQPMRFWLT
jgi:predicted alpha/beta superfamily hydrolase